MITMCSWLRFLLVSLLAFLVNCEPPPAPQRSDLQSISVTSTRIDPDGRDRYGHRKLTDRTLGSWCSAGNGIGDTITIKIKGPPRGLKELYISNGFGDPKKRRQYNSIKELIVNEEHTVKVPRFARMTKISMPEVIVADEFRLKIKSIFKGLAKDHTCVTELSFDSISTPKYPWQLMFSRETFNEPGIKLDGLGLPNGLHLYFKVHGEISGVAVPPCSDEQTGGCRAIGYWKQVSKGEYEAKFVGQCHKDGKNCTKIEVPLAIKTFPGELEINGKFYDK